MLERAEWSDIVAEFKSDTLKQEKVTDAQVRQDCDGKNYCAKHAKKARKIVGAAFNLNAAGLAHNAAIDAQARTSAASAGSQM